VEKRCKTNDNLLKDAYFEYAKELTTKTTDSLRSRKIVPPLQIATAVNSKHSDAFNFIKYGEVYPQLLTFLQV
jgi:hypothetical protein